MTRRRILTLVGVAFLSPIVGVVVLLGLAIGDAERMVAYFEVAEIPVEGPATITETIDYNFGAGNERHGIYRVVPGLVELREVSSATAPDSVLVTGSNIRIGSPSRTIRGQHRYTVAYTVTGVSSGNEFAWNVVGDEWDVAIESVEAHVVSARRLSDVTCDKGSIGDVGGCTAEQVGEGHLVIRTGRVSSGEAVTVRATLGGPVESAAPTIDVPPPAATTSPALLRPILLATIASVLGGVVAMVVARRVGREEAPVGVSVDGIVPPGSTGPTLVDASDLDDMAGTRPAAPRRLTPSEGGVVLAEKVTADHKAAWLVDQAVHGAVAFSGDDDKKPTLEWRGGNGAEGNAVLLRIFQGRSSVDLGKYDKSFAAGWSLLGTELDSWRSSSGLWSDEAERLRNKVIGWGVMGMIVLAVVTGVYAWRTSLTGPSAAVFVVLGALFGLALGGALSAWELRRRTAEGSSLYVEVAGFRNHLESVEGDSLRMVADAGLLHDHLAWAVALGVSGRWVKALERAGIEPSRYFHHPHLLYVSTHLATATSSSSTAPSSSGGGGAGGGGGGGGGGSW